MRPFPITARRGSAARSALLVVAALVVIGLLGWVVAKRYRPDLFDREAVNAAEYEALQSARLSATPTAATDVGWPQWLGPTRDGRAPAGPLRTDWDANPPKPVWSTPCGGGYSSLSVVGGRVYGLDRQGTRERLFCLDAEKGTPLWETGWDADYAAMDHGAGPRAAPTVHEGRVYAVGAVGKFVCVELPSGSSTPRTLWEHDLKAEFQADTPTWGFASSPLIEGDLVIVQAGGDKGSVVAFDKKSGELRWGAGTDPNGYSSPIAATVAGVRQIIAVTGTAIVGVRPADGKVLWRHDWPTRFNGNIATPLVVGDYVFVSSAYSKGCCLLRLAADGDGVTAERVYYRKSRVMENHHSTCVYKDGFLYGFDSDVFRCVDLRKGEVNEDWTARGLSGGVGKGCLILADKYLIIQTQSGDLCLVDADPAEFRLRGRVADVLSGSDCWALPVLVDGRLYLRDHTKVVCLDVRPK
ncbi:MAG TPA: PQQ-binding-like beta-propeller repeat protein [Fimbriiglobus sp.]|nr:PQQ-binding-like beta-propeller repeat protein [Fimbriiglobus sp.]